MVQPEEDRLHLLIRGSAQLQPAAEVQRERAGKRGGHRLGPERLGQLRPDPERFFTGMAAAEDAAANHEAAPAEQRAQAHPLPAAHLLDQLSDHHTRHQ